MNKFEINEKHQSQVPALQLLINLGYQYITPSEALKERQGRLSNVILEGILRNKLKEINRITYKGNEYLFSEENIQSAIQRLKNIKYDGLLRTNETVYDMLTLGTSLEQTIDGDSKSYNLNYIDWRNPEKNSFHAAAEYSVEKARSNETVRPDIVLFVNGIPLCVIECKSPNIEINQAISQTIRNQGEDHIAKLFIYTQMLIATNKNNTKYSTTGAKEEFWGVWKESQLTNSKRENEKIRNYINKKTDEATLKKIKETIHINIDPESQDRCITEQDIALYALCRPERLLEIAWKYTIFDNGIKKIARYQQYFVIKSTLERIKQKDSSGCRKGGIIWHTQGSGKSLTMVMLVRNMALDPEIQNPRIVLVTDRDDLDIQLANTFAACDLNPSRATSGKNLIDLVHEKKPGIITTLIHKFDKAMSIKKNQDDSANIFVLVDESHRTQFGTFAAKMRLMFPNACYLGFTGTPLMKKEKNNFRKFGGLIEPHYSMKQAVEDEAVVPLLYEGRDVKIEQNKEAIDLWFERHTQGLTLKQKADLKKKYARSEMLNKADRVIYMRAFDISEHFRSNWQGTGFKAQLVAPTKAAAIKYQEYLDEIGMVTSEIIISPPDTREGYEEVDEEPADEVVKFWNKMMKRYGSEEEYTKQIISQFKNKEEVEILIVVSKLLTGFDAPRNAVLYLCKKLEEHSLLQAIARVNRIYDKKEFGYVIDYYGLLGELDKALNMYNVLEGFDEDDLSGTMTSINVEINKLPQRYSDLWDIFKTIKNSSDEEEYELLLADDAIREEFYKRLSEYSKTLGIALSSEMFLKKIDDKTLSNYKKDLTRFYNLKMSVKGRYADSVDYKDYEPKIKKLLDMHIRADEVVQLNAPVNIFDENSFMAVKEEQSVYGKEKTIASKADAIAHATKKIVIENMDEDPAFYEKFSKLIQQAIDDFRAKRISDLLYLEIATDANKKVLGKVHDDVPEKISQNEDAIAYYGVLKRSFKENGLNEHETEEISIDTALAIFEILSRYEKVLFWDDDDAKKLAINDIDDYLYDEVKKVRGIELTTAQMDEIIEITMKVAESRKNK